MCARLEGIRQRRLIESSSTSLQIVKAIRKPSALAAAIGMLALLLVAGGLVYRHYARIRWVHKTALPELQKLALESKGMAFYRLMEQAKRYSPNRSGPHRIGREICMALSRHH
jgi:hypothetical protein